MRPRLKKHKVPSQKLKERHVGDERNTPFNDTEYINFSKIETILNKIIDLERSIHSSVLIMMGLHAHTNFHMFLL